MGDVRQLASRHLTLLQRVHRDPASLNSSAHDEAARLDDCLAYLHGDFLQAPLLASGLHDATGYDEVNTASALRSASDDMSDSEQWMAALRQLLHALAGSARVAVAAGATLTFFRHLQCARHPTFDLLRVVHLGGSPTQSAGTAMAAAIGQAAASATAWPHELRPAISAGDLLAHQLTGSGTEYRDVLNSRPAVLTRVMQRLTVPRPESEPQSRARAGCERDERYHTGLAASAVAAAVRDVAAEVLSRSRRDWTAALSQGQLERNRSMLMALHQLAHGRRGHMCAVTDASGQLTSAMLHLLCEPTVSGGPVTVCSEPDSDARGWRRAQPFDPVPLFGRWSGESGDNPDRGASVAASTLSGCDTLALKGSESQHSNLEAVSAAATVTMPHSDSKAEPEMMPEASVKPRGPSSQAQPQPEMMPPLRSIVRRCVNVEGSLMLRLLGEAHEGKDVIAEQLQANLTFLARSYYADRFSYRRHIKRVSAAVVETLQRHGIGLQRYHAEPGGAAGAASAAGSPWSGAARHGEGVNLNLSHSDGRCDSTCGNAAAARLSGTLRQAQPRADSDSKSGSNEPVVAVRSAADVARVPALHALLHHLDNAVLADCAAEQMRKATQGDRATLEVYSKTLGLHVLLWAFNVAAQAQWSATAFDSTGLPLAAVEAAVTTAARWLDGSPGKRDRDPGPRRSYFDLDEHEFLRYRAYRHQRWTTLLL